MQRISIFLLAIFSVLVSCTRDLVPDNDGFAQLDVDYTIITNDSNHFPWGSESPNSAGLTHNDYVGQALEYLKDNPEATILQALQTITSSGITAAEIDSICTRISSKSDIEIESTIVSSLKTSRAIELFYAIDTALFTSTSYNILSNKLDSIQLLVEADLLYHDWDIVMVYLETVNASAYFWYPSSHGGSGNGGLEDNVTGLPGWAMADGRGAGYGMTMWAYTGGFGGLAGFFASTVFSAAFSSLDYNRYN